MTGGDLAASCQAELSAIGFVTIKPHIYGRSSGGVLQSIHFSYSKSDSYVWFSTVSLAEPNLSLNRGAPGACGREPSSGEALSHRVLTDEQLLAAIYKRVVDGVLPQTGALCNARLLCARLGEQRSAYATYVKAFVHFQLREFDKGRGCLETFFNDPRLKPHGGQR